MPISSGVTRKASTTATTFTARAISLFCAFRALATMVIDGVSAASGARKAIVNGVPGTAGRATPLMLKITVETLSASLA